MANINKVTLSEYLRLRGLNNTSDIDAFDIQVLKIIGENGKGYCYEFSNDYETMYFSTLKKAKDAKRDFYRFK